MASDPRASRDAVTVDCTGTPDRLEAEAFLSALVRGAPWATEETWTRYSSMVHGVLQRGLGTGEDVEDAVQEVFLRVFDRVRFLRDATALRAFVFSIAVRVMHWQLRRRMVRRWVRLSKTGEVPEISQAPVDSEGREALRRLYVLLEKLRPLDRTIFVLRQSEQMSVVEIARTTGASLSTVKRRLLRTVDRVDRLIRADALLVTYLSRSGLTVVRGRDESVGGEGKGEGEGGSDD